MTADESQCRAEAIGIAVNWSDRGGLIAARASEGLAIMVGLLSNLSHDSAPA